MIYLEFSYAMVSAILTYELAKVSWLAIFYGATFVGMSSSFHFERLAVLMASLLFIIIFHILGPYTQAMGGTLGFSAFISGLIIFYLKKFILTYFNLD